MSKIKLHIVLFVGLAFGCAVWAADTFATEGGGAAKPPADFEFHPPYEPVLEPPDMPSQRSDKEPGGTADHSKFEALQKDFKTGPEVTEACLSCHTEAGKDFMKSVHWTWEYKNPATGQLLGKKHLINNFCTNARGNEGACTQCHAGYGWVDDTFDFTDQTKIDCLVCQDRKSVV